MNENEQDPFPVVGGRPRPGVPVQEENRDSALSERIERLIASSPVFLFMKGTPEMPQCGFSANVVAILNSFDVPYKTFDILSDEDIRQGVKEYAEWPTFPQLYVGGKLIGGNDVVTELHEEGELASVLKVH